MAQREDGMSILFTVRLWLEDLGEGEREWRGCVRHVRTGEIRYFREWPALAAIVQEMLAPRTTPPDPPTG